MTALSFRHVVALTFDGADPGAIDAIVDALRALPDRIEAIGAYEVGRDLGLADDNATVVVVADFADQAAYETYRDHPVHQQVIADQIRPIITGRTAVQHRRDA